MAIQYYQLRSPREGFTRRVYFNTVGQFWCPEYDPKAWGTHDHERVQAGTVRREPVGEKVVTTTEMEDGSTIVSVTTVTRKFKVLKSGIKPTCKCGKEMVWKGWPVWLKDEKTNAAILGGIARDATDDTNYWTKWAKTLKQRDSIVDTALKNNR